MGQKTLELLESIMSGHQMTASELDDLINNKVSEDLFLDYKHGNELIDSNKARATIRQYVSGFANSTGGILIIGIDEVTWNVTGCTAPGGGDLREWASRCLTPIAPYFSPPPIFQIIPHSNGNVLIIATERSLGLVPYKEKDEIVYYFRFHDQTLNNKTLKAPEYLITDIVLGRRQKPYLNITNLGLIGQAQERPQDNSRYLTFGLVFTIENESLSWANHLKSGIIGWTEQTQSSLSRHLISHIEIKELDTRFTKYGINPVHYPVKVNSTPIELDPFAVFRYNLTSITLPLRVNSDWYQYIWKAALYLMSKESPPIWYQLKLNVNKNFPAYIHEHPNSLIQATEGGFFEGTRLSGQRPTVEIETI